MEATLSVSIIFFIFSDSTSISGFFRILHPTFRKELSEVGGRGDLTMYPWDLLRLSTLPYSIHRCRVRRVMASLLLKAAMKFPKGMQNANK